MAHSCGCHGHAHPATAGAQAPITADRTVGDVAHHYPGALEAMQAMGINHCCGAALTLEEAAAAAGVPLDALLAALNERQGTSA
jgi:iron-sulfur cluster repair protein YtfE (RIC family)